MGQDTRAASSDPVDALLAVLRADGGRATLARRLLLTVLIRNRGHRTAGQIAADVQARAPGTNMSTIYRNLDELCRLGVIDRTRIGDGPATYHLAAPGHAHLACEHCGTVTEIPGELLTGLTQAIRDQYGFDVRPHHVAVPGRCAHCRHLSRTAETAR